MRLRNLYVKETEGELMREVGRGAFFLFFEEKPRELARLKNKPQLIEEVCGV